MGEWETLTSRVAYENPFMRVHEDTAITPTGKDAIYGYCESTEGSAYIVPVGEDGQIHLIEQYRYPLKKNYWEIPAGRIPHDEDIAEGARRELVEETGLQAVDMTHVGTLLSAPGITNFTSEVFLARKLTKVSDELDADDGINRTHAVSRTEFRNMVRARSIQCGSSIAAIYMCLDFIEEEKV